MTNQELRNTIDELKALPKENEWVEFKSGNATTHDKLGQYISALSNGACISNQLNILDHTGPAFWRILGHRSGA